MERQGYYSHSRLLTLVAVILFVLAGFGVTTHSLSELDIVAFGLAFYAAARFV